MANPTQAQANQDQSDRQTPKVTHIPRAQASINTAAIENQLQYYETNGCNLASIGAVAVGEFFPFIPVFEALRADPDPYGPDVWPSKGKLILRHQFLVKLAAAANISWEPGLTGVRRMEYGKFAICDAVGKAIRPDGSIFAMAASGEINEEIIREDVEAEYQGKADAKSDLRTEEAKQKWMAPQIDRDVRQKKRHMTAQAETKAKDRVIRAMLGLKGTYTKEEITFPFLVVWYTPREDYKDPAARERAIARAHNNVTQLFGKKNTPPITPTPQENPTAPPADQPQTPAASSLTTKPDMVPNPNKPIPGTNGFIPNQPWPLEVFGVKARDVRIKALKAFADHLDYEGKGRDEKVIMNMDENTMVQFYEILLAKAAGR